MNVRSHNCPIILSSLAGARPAAGIREALRSVRCDSKAWNQETLRGSSADKEGRLTRRIRERRTKWANEAWLVSPYYPACAHLRRRMDDELLPQVRTASDLSENETLSSNTKAIC